MLAGLQKIFRQTFPLPCTSGYTDWPNRVFLWNCPGGDSGFTNKLIFYAFSC